MSKTFSYKSISEASKLETELRKIIESLPGYWKCVNNQTEFIYFINQESAEDFITDNDASHFIKRNLFDTSEDDAMRMAKIEAKIRNS